MDLNNSQPQHESTTDYVHLAAGDIGGPSAGATLQGIFP